MVPFAGESPRQWHETFFRLTLNQHDALKTKETICHMHSKDTLLDKHGFKILILTRDRDITVTTRKLPVFSLSSIVCTASVR